MTDILTEEELEKTGWILGDTCYYEMPENLKSITPEFDQGPDPRPGNEDYIRPVFPHGTWYGFNPRKALAQSRLENQALQAQIKRLVDALETINFHASTLESDNRDESVREALKQCLYIVTNTLTEDEVLSALETFEAERRREEEVATLMAASRPFKEFWKVAQKNPLAGVGDEFYGLHGETYLRFSEFKAIAEALEALEGGK